MQASQTNTEGTAWCLAPETTPRDPPPNNLCPFSATLLVLSQATHHSAK